MESTITKDLYFAGEVLEPIGPTGGYNLKIAFSTGYLAGLSASKKITSFLNIIYKYININIIIS